MLPWIEKYRPTLLNNIVLALQKEIKNAGKCGLSDVTKLFLSNIINSHQEFGVLNNKFKMEGKGFTNIKFLRNLRKNLFCWFSLNFFN